MKIIHFCAGLQGWNGMANTARQFVDEEVAAGHDSMLTCNVADIEGKVDVVHIHGAWLPTVHKVAKRAKELGAKLIIRPAGSYDPVRRRFHWWKKWLMAPWEHAMLRRADVVLATCPQEADWIREYHGRAHVELTDLKRFFNIEKGNREQGTGNRVEGRPLHVLYLGRMHPLKGVRYLERAVEEINRERRSREEVKVKSGHEDIRSSKFDSISLRIESNIYGEEKEKAWEWCDVFCLPTLSENFGRVVAEALERGKRVITTDGAPAWFDLKPSQGCYLKGYREGTDEERVKLLKEALGNC